MILADAVLSALRGFAGEVATWTNQGTLFSITGHIAQIENAVATDIHAGETAAKAVLTDLYGAFHGHNSAEPTPAEAATSLPTAQVFAVSSSQPDPNVTGTAVAPPTQTTTVTAPLLATGGPVAQTPVVVGEHGPETVVLPAPAAPTV